MPNPEDPGMGNWYYDMRSGERFAVIQSDENAVQIQLADGDLAEMTMQEWRARDLKPDQPPLNWTLPMDSPSAKERGEPIKVSDVLGQADIDSQ